MATMNIMRGGSGFGKTTYVKKNLSNCVVCSADHFFIRNGQYVFNGAQLGAAHTQCYDKAREACEFGADVVIDNTNTTIKEIKRYTDLAKEYDYDVVVIRMDAPVDVAFKRNTHGVPEKSVQAMVDRFQDYPGEIIVSGVS